LSLPCLLGNDNTTRGTIHDIRNHTPDHPPTAARPEQLLPRDNGYACHEVAVEKLGKFTVRVWRHLHRDCDGTRFEFDATIDGLVDAASSGLGSDPQRLRELTSWSPIPWVVRELHSCGIAHLPVRLRDGAGLVGPLVVPGVTTCVGGH